MEFTGSPNFNLHQALNLVAEQVTSIPVWSSAQKGRLLQVTAGADLGFHYGGDTAWIKFAEDSDLELVGIPYFFTTRGGLGKSTTTTMYAVGEVLKYHPTYRSGSIIAITVSSTYARTQGEAEFTPLIAGSPVTASGIIVKLDATNTIDVYGSISKGTTGAIFTAGQKLALKAVSDANWETSHPSLMEDIAGCLYAVLS